MITKAIKIKLKQIKKKYHDEDNINDAIKVTIIVMILIKQTIISILLPDQNANIIFLIIYYNKPPLCIVKSRNLHANVAHC